MSIAGVYLKSPHSHQSVIKRFVAALGGVEIHEKKAWQGAVHILCHGSSRQLDLLCHTESKKHLLTLTPYEHNPVLYYVQTAAGVAFASCPSILMKSGWCGVEVNEQSLAELINTGRVRTKRTLFKNVYRLTYGQKLVVTPSGDIEVIEDYTKTKQPWPEAFYQVTQDLKSGLKNNKQLLSTGSLSSLLLAKSFSHEELSIIAPDLVTDVPSDERLLIHTLATDMGLGIHDFDFSEKDFWHYLVKYIKASADLLVSPFVLWTFKAIEEGGQKTKEFWLADTFEGHWLYKYSAHGSRVMGFLRQFGSHSRGESAGRQHIFRQPQFSQWRQEKLNPEKIIAADHPAYLGMLQGTGQFYHVRLLSPWLDKSVLMALAQKSGEQPARELLIQSLKDEGVDLNIDKRYTPFSIPIHQYLLNKQHAIHDYLHSHEAIGHVCVRKELRQWLAQPLEKRDSRLLFNLLCYALWYDLHMARRPLPESLFRFV